MAARPPERHELDPIEIASRDEIAALQLGRLKASLRRAYDHVAHYRAAFDQAGVHPDDLRELSDLAKFPFTTKDDLRRHYPFGMFAVPRQQVEAAQAMNMGRLETNLLVVLPQAWPVIVPPAVAFAVSFIKDTALVSQIGVFELTFRGKELNNQGYSGLLVFSTIAFCYFLISYPLSRLGQHLEKRLETPRGQRRARRLRGV